MSSDCSAFSPLHALSVSNGLSKADKLLDDEVTSNASGQSSPLSPVSPRSQLIASPTPFSPSSSNTFNFSSPVPATHKSVISITSCDSNVTAPVASNVNAAESSALNNPVSGPMEKYIVSEKLEHFLKTAAPPTPYLVVDTDIVEENYRSLTTALPYARVFYAVKANPATPIVDRLTGLGSCFDTASRNEIDKVLAAGNSADRISFGNTIKKQRDIEYAYSKGVRLYAVDSEPELIKIAQAAPGARVFCRILVECIGAEWPLSKKFGCSPDMAVELLIKAQSMGLEAYGVSFHPGSQQTNLSQWDIAIGEAARVFRLVAEQGVTLRMLNIGGGFPARYRAAVQPLESYAAAVSAALNKYFPNGYPEIIIEPGRSMVGDAGVLQAEVVLISRKGLPTESEGAKRWVYLDAGKFNGLAETMDESIKYRIRTPHDQGPRGPVVLAGPTCDSADIMYEKHTYQLPLDLAIGDKVEVLSAGAYTTTYASVCFNGFDPLQCYCI